MEDFCETIQLMHIFFYLLKLVISKKKILSDNNQYICSKISNQVQYSPVELFTNNEMLNIKNKTNDTV